MGIGINRHADIAMAQDFLHYIGIHSHTQQMRRGAVPQVMERYVWETSLFEHFIKHLQDITGIERPIFQSCEDVILRMPLFTLPNP